ncbi:MAG: DUF1028 domain-containing protein [Planctomycetes bacterium]|nr:DUF1028 domain-containing protein [Planctomycetota bacterium]
MVPLRLLSWFFGALLLAASPLRATWSIVIVDLATGEVAIGIATCLTGFDLRPATIVVVPGYGAAAAQSFIGPLALRELIRSGLLAGTPAAQILAQLAAADVGHQGRQYGIVGLTHGEVTFTGSQAFAWAGGVTGQVGSLRYAIQGNVLTGQPVVAAAELALQTTPGSIADRLMAAMAAARQYGGDGRCSCSVSQPTACGSPPASFTKSAHIAQMVVSRPSDVDAPCTTALGCGAGQYWLDLNVANQPATALDPVLQLQALYANWQAQQVGRADHFASGVALSTSTLRSNGSDTLYGTVTLRDASGAPIAGTPTVTVGLRAGSTATGVVFSPVTPQANGTYTFTMRAGFGAGQAILDVAAVDAVGRVGIWPQPVVAIGDPFGPCGRGAIADGAGGVFDALSVSGSGGSNRVVEVGYGQPFSLALAPPVGVPTGFPVGLFALWLHVGANPVGFEVPLGAGNGALCFTPAPFVPAPTLVLADTFGLGGLLPAVPAPWSLNLPGVPAVFDAVLQAVMVSDAAATFAATNAVLLRFVPLPAPVITQVLPIAAVAGQTVTVTGTNFVSGMQATLAGSPLALGPVAPVQTSFVMPPGVPCDAPLVLVNPGSGPAQRVVNPTPLVTSVQPASGTRFGGTTVVLVGQNLLGTTVTFGGVPLQVVAQTATTIVGTTPAGAPGAAAVQVVHPNGCQSAATFTYF